MLSEKNETKGMYYDVKSNQSTKVKSDLFLLKIRMTTQQMIEALMEEIAERKNYTYDCNKENGYNKLYDKLFPIYLHHVLIWIRNKNFNAKINEE